MENEKITSIPHIPRWMFTVVQQMAENQDMGNWPKIPTQVTTTMRRDYMDEGEAAPPVSKGEMEDEDRNTGSKYIQWSSSDGSVYFPCCRTYDKLKPGFYQIIKCDGVLGLEKFPVKTDELIRFPEAVTDEIITEIQTFWERADIFKKYGLIHKRGMLLYGPPGNGKSCVLQLICEDVISRGGIVLKFNSPGWTSAMLKRIREIQPDTPIVILMEDIDSIIEESCESDVLNILDGVDRVDKAVFIATTNYPERLGKRIINRPSRFDKRFDIGYPSKASRKIFFKHLFSKEPEESWDIDVWVDKTEKMSFAHLKELFVASVILGDSFDDALETLTEMMNTELDSENSSINEKAGFGHNK